MAGYRYYRALCGNFGGGWLFLSLAKLFAKVFSGENDRDICAYPN